MTPTLNFGETFSKCDESNKKKLTLHLSKLTQIGEKRKNGPLVYLKIEFAILNQSQVYSLKKLQFQSETYICSRHVHLYMQ